MRANEFLTELFDPQASSPLEWDDTFAPTEIHATAHDRQGRTINISFVPFHTGKDWQAIDIEFTRGGSHDVTGRGDAERVFATVINAIKTYLNQYNKPLFVLFSGKEQSRFKLYSRMIARFAAQFGYQVVPYEQLPHELRDVPGLPRDVFALMRGGATVSENFKDGENPGRKGLSKRMGVNCKQSVSKLRKIAADSSGERQRMAHWCANMKSGKKKK